MCVIGRRARVRVRLVVVVRMKTRTRDRGRRSQGGRREGPDEMCRV